MPVLRFHAVGDWAASQVRTAWAPSSHHLPADAADLVDQAWRAAIARPGVKLFDGPMCRIESWAVRDGALDVALSRTSYKAFFGTNLSHPELADRFGPSVLANPVGVSPALETSDGYLLMGRRNDSVAYYPGRVHPFAGCLEPGDVGSESGEVGGVARVPDLFAAVRRELAEELSLTGDDIEQIRCTGIVEDVARRQPELIFRVRSPRTRDEIQAQVARDEHQASVAVPANDEGVTAMLRERELTPVGRASLLLWGRVALGDEWFDRRRADV